MNVFTLFRNILVLCFFVCTLNQTYSQVTIDYEDFESGWGIWNDGGNDCSLENPEAPNNNAAIRLRDNSGASSSTTSDNLNLTSYDQIDITFDYETNSFETNEDFFVRYSDDSGSSWTTIQTFTVVTDFSNNTKYTETISIDSGTYTFTSTSQFRFQADASNNGDELFIDNIHIEGIAAGSCTIVNTYPYNEDFESGLGNWSQDTADNFDWTRNNGGTPSGNTGPNSAGSGSYYMFTEATYNYGNTANLESPCFDLSSISNPELSFAYHMYGGDMGTLYVDVSTDSGSSYVNIWSQAGQVQTLQSDPWINTNINLSSYAGQTIKLRFRGLTGSAYRSDMAIDNVNLIDSPCTSVVSSFPYTESFESGIGLWNQDGSDDFDWTRNTGGTPSSNTGPNAASNGSYYMFTEATYNYGNTSNLVSPCFDLSSLANPEITFAYHMYGGDMGTLYVDISTDYGSNYTNIWTQNGETQSAHTDPWLTARINLSSYSGQVITLRFRGLTGSDYRSDIAIDDIGIAEGIACSNIVTSYPYNEGFESGIGLWNQDNTDNFDWTRNNGGTPSGSTGPNSASSGSYYMYTEATYNYGNTGNLESPCFDLTSLPNPEFSFAYHMYGADMGTLYVDISTDGGTSFTNLWSQSGQSQSNQSDPWLNANIDLTAYTGQIVMMRFRGYTGTWYRSDMAIDDIAVINIIPSPEIKLLGNNIEIVSGDNTPDYNDDTNFGIINIGSPFEQNFTIDNTDGTADLDISNITLSNTTDFAITGTPYSTPVSAGNSTQFNITYNAITTGSQTCTVTINNNDSDESVYTFEIEASAIQFFYDSDGDGILDNSDIDDDNDGIIDTVEETSCEAVNGATVNYKFLNETFGVGTGRTTIDSNNYAATTTYCYEDGTGGGSTTECPNLSSWILDDGEYVVVSKITGTTASDPENIHGDLAWYNGEDHTPGDTNGRMAVFNASYTPGVFYETTISGILSNLPITYSFWALNIMAQSTFPGSILPNITVKFYDLDENELASFDTGEFGRCTASTTDNACSQGEWHQFSTSVNLGNTNSFIVRFINNAPGGGGNDLAIDDIVIAQTLCDTDRDGVADVFDLDSDNDGIPDVVEAGLGDYSEGSATLTFTSGWSDTNSNGLNDSNEGHTILDSDNDGVPNFIDLDSDNDTIFDVDESKTGNSSDISFENGDGDINGDGTGDGIDSDAVRIKDENYDNVAEYFPDGILDVYDFYNGGTFATAYGNQNQGLGSTYYVVDSDNDGTPDYIDITSDGSTYDISATLYADLDTNGNGRIGGTNYTDDADLDGILDLFDTDDASFGSPRDLDRKLHLYFDGRNDYASESSIISGWSQGTLMAWIKTNGTPSNNQVILGQDEFYLEITPSMNIVAYGGDDSVSNDFALTADRWYHVAATYNSANSKLTVYINGENINETSVSGALSVDNSSFTIGKSPDLDSNYFRGYIDEVRVFNKALSDDELQKMVYQELNENSGVVRGSVIPENITDYVDANNINDLSWGSMERYYRMDVYKDDIIDNLTTTATDIGTGMKIYNSKLIEIQTAPLPYVTQRSGSLPSALDIPEDGVYGLDAINYDWSIVRIEHNNVTFNNYQKHIGLLIDATDASNNPIEFSVQDDSEISVSWYLKLDGFIDLEGESQLIQGPDSKLDNTSSGTLERDQQGTADQYTYNYWSSPVGFSNSTTNNNSFALPDILNDGTDEDNPNTINYLTSGYDGTATTPIGIADYWIWKFSNQLHDEYSAWQHVRSTGSILAGEGFTMKGPGTGTVIDSQNYAFNGKPNNGTISLTVNAGNDYLVGNPYPSAINADQFINDNSTSISGTLYFWEHWGGGSHVLAEYQGGYGTYNLSGGAPAAAPDPDVAQVGNGTKIPGQYIPVSQGFFVLASGTGGSITFNNGQRIFQTEGVSSVFMNPENIDLSSERSTNSSDTKNEDNRMKIRLGLNSINTYHRQLLVTADENATVGYDYGYDGMLHEDQLDDMYWLIEDEKYVIQGIDGFNFNTVLPLGIHTENDGMNTIKVDALENVPENIGVLLHDKELNSYHDLRTGDYEFYMIAGEELDRFEIRFKRNALDIEDFDFNNLTLYYSNDLESIVLVNPTLMDVKSIQMYNILGQEVLEINTTAIKQLAEYKVSNLNSGTYILKINTPSGNFSKKVLVK